MEVETPCIRKQIAFGPCNVNKHAYTYFHQMWYVVCHVIRVVEWVEWEGCAVFFPDRTLPTKFTHAQTHTLTHTHGELLPYHIIHTHVRYARSSRPRPAVPARRSPRLPFRPLISRWRSKRAHAFMDQRNTHTYTHTQSTAPARRRLRRPAS